MASWCSAWACGARTPGPPQAGKSGVQNFMHARPTPTGSLRLGRQKRSDCGPQSGHGFIWIEPVTALAHAGLWGAAAEKIQGGDVVAVSSAAAKRLGAGIRPSDNNNCATLGSPSSCPTGPRRRQSSLLGGSRASTRLPNIAPEDAARDRHKSQTTVRDDDQWPAGCTSLENDAMWPG
ncbi:hypothetical protein EJ04DRAFT_524035 [Polyplosphaeria fusca]|uniref:Uncharacterized protein n=1 Tax=Polyplosphaeria fusca TaxID=682080 RepID=A0A9P4V106_9PLEO|nr:hypothetical protein EJ04DRAFT_524035 [Polyplosphaeria fusca]